MEHYSRETLRILRNVIPMKTLIEEVLKIPCKRSEGYFRFLCPQCSEFNSAINPYTNLARCFRCKKNYNPIDLVMSATKCSFVDAVEFLLPLA
jgi:DNA primase